MAIDIFLVKKAKMGDEEAFITLIRDYEEILYNTARRFLQNEEDIADALQETVITAYQKLEQLRNPQYFNTWVCRILINQCKRRIEKVAHLSIEDYQISDNNQMVQSELEDLLIQLSPLYRIPLVLFYYNGFTVKEISRILDEPSGTIKSRLARGRILLQKEYERAEGGLYNG